MLLQYGVYFRFAPCGVIGVDSGQKFELFGKQDAAEVLVGLAVVQFVLSGDIVGDVLQRVIQEAVQVGSAFVAVNCAAFGGDVAVWSVRVVIAVGDGGAV